MKKNRSLALIDGWWGSGKTTLRGLLDGHPQLAVCPIQESLVGVLSHDPGKLYWLEKQEITGLRACLGANIGYSRIERFALAKIIAFDAARRVRVERPFHFDYYAFDQEWTQRVLSEDNLNLSKLIDIYYQTFMEYWADFAEVGDDCSYYVSLDDNRRNTVSFFTNNYPQGKLLYLVRDPKGIIATRAGRLPCKGESRTASWDELTCEELIRNRELHRIRDAYAHVRQLARQYPDRILPVSFEALVEDTAVTMKQVADFLGIDYGGILEEFTYLGESIGAVEGVSFIGKVNDDPRDLLDGNTYTWAQLILREKPLSLQTMMQHPRAMSRFLSRESAERIFRLYHKVERVVRSCIPR